MIDNNDSLTLKDLKEEKYGKINTISVKSFNTNYNESEMEKVWQDILAEESRNRASSNINLG